MIKYLDDLICGIIYDSLDIFSFDCTILQLFDALYLGDFVIMIGTYIYSQPSLSQT